MPYLKSAIAKILLLAYLISMLLPALSAKGLELLSAGKLKKVCKRSYAVTEKASGTPLQLYFTAAENELTAGSQAAQVFICGSSSVDVPPALASAVLAVGQQEKDDLLFTPSLYTILFQELDPDPPKVSFC
jgi:hypothetical protein